MQLNVTTCYVCSVEQYRSAHKNKSYRAVRKVDYSFKQDGEI